MTFKDFIRLHILPDILDWIYGIESCENMLALVKSMSHVDSVRTKEGVEFKFTRHFCLIYDITQTEYDLSDVRETDIVLDIGAYIGTVTVQLARMATHVYAVEPLFTDELRETIRLNNLENVTVIEAALGDGTPLDISYHDTLKRDVPTIQFKELIEMCGGRIDFLKCDCEGGEWYIDPTDLNFIRRIEMEVHPRMGPTERCNLELIPFIKTAFEYSIKINDPETYTIHAKRLPTGSGLIM